MAEDRMLSDEILLGIINSKSGGGGTTDYSQLSNKPQINSVELSGNKSLSDLSIASATALGTVSNAVTAIKDGTNIDSFGDVETALAGKQDAVLFGGVNPSSGKDGDVYMKLVRDESTLIDMFGSPSAESTDDYEMSYTVSSSVMGDYYDYEAFGTGKGFGQNSSGSTSITYHFKNGVKFKPANVTYCNNFNLSGGGYLQSASFTIQASTDGTNWDTLYSNNVLCDRDGSITDTITASSYYSYFKFEMQNSGGYTGIKGIVVNGIAESYSNIGNIYFKNGGTWLKDAFASKAELDAKQDTLTFDDVPTANSNNPVKSSGVKSAIDAAVASAYHHAGTKTCAELVAGLLIAANEGNVYNITDSGTTTADFIDGAGQPIKAGDNVGIAKISDSVYKFDLLSGFVDTTNFVQKSQTVGLIKNDGTIDTVAKQPVTDNNLETTAKTIVGAINEHEGDISSLRSGLTNVNVALSVSENSGKNMLPLTLAQLKSANTTGTWADNVYTLNSVDFTVSTDNDGRVTEITANGTASTNTNFFFVRNVTNIYSGNILNGCVDGSSSTYYIALSLNASPWTTNTCYNSDTTITIPKTATIESYIRIANGYVANNVAFYPMIRPATITDATFAPYVPSVESRLGTVESAITFSTMGGGTNLSGYDSTANSYVFPSDGYVAGTASSTGLVIRVGDANYSHYLEANISGSNYLYVKKGMRMYVYQNPSDYGVWFTPIG